MSRVLPILGAVLVVAFFLVLPAAGVFTEALRHGPLEALASLGEPDAVAAIRLTLFVVVLAVPLNTVGGLAAAWAIARFRFPGRGLLVVLIELPLSVSPVVSGLVWVLLFGAQGWLGPSLRDHDMQIIFAVPGVVLATMFVTFPFVARTVLPLMESQGSASEEAAMLLGAGFWTILWRITLPEIRWALLSGVLLCTARAMGEFGAVSVVSGHIPGRTQTMPLHIEALYDDYQSVAAFSMAALLALFALATLAAKAVLEARIGRPEPNRTGLHRAAIQTGA